LVVLKEANMPAVLFECGIIKNRNEELQLGDQQYQHKLVVALFNAIKLFCSQPNIIGGLHENTFPLSAANFRGSPESCLIMQKRDALRFPALRPFPYPSIPPAKPPDQ